MDNIILNLKVDANMFNTIMTGLEELPHKVSRKIIDELSQQAQAQIQQRDQQKDLDS